MDFGVTGMVVISPNSFSSACIVTGLVALPNVRAVTLDDFEAHKRGAPDIVLLQELAGQLDDRWLPHWLTRVPQIWPSSRILVLTDDLSLSAPLCVRSRASACLSSTATLDELAATILLILADKIVYERKIDLLAPPPGGHSANSVATGADAAFHGVSGANGSTADRSGDEGAALRLSKTRTS